jgi:hypothetical protein
LDLQKIVSELELEKDRIGRAIAALIEPASSGLSGWKSGAPGKAAAPGRRKKRRAGMTPQGRKRLSLAMKKRWAERRKKSS